MRSNIFDKLSDAEKEKVKVLGISEIFNHLTGSD